MGHQVFKKNTQEKLVFDHSDEIHEILGRKPLWILRWGVSILLLIVLGVIMGCCFIRYPQTVTAHFTLTSDCPPSDLKARISGTVDSLFANNGDTLICGQLIALIASPTDYQSILDLDSLLAEMDNQELDLELINRLISFSFHLGNLQSDWIELQSLCADYSDYLISNRIGRKKALVAEQVNRAREHYSRLEEQRATLAEELQYEIRALRRDSILFSKNAIPEIEYEEAQKSVISKENVLDGFDASMSNTKLSLLQLEQQSIELDIQFSSDVTEYEHRIIRQKDNLKGRLALWKEQYTVAAPFDGIVSLQNVWGKGQTIGAGETLASITPVIKQRIIGRLKVLSSGFGKIAIGQEVNIKLHGFPFLEYGILKGEVATISSVPENTSEGLFYTINVSFPNGLVSTYKKQFPFVQDMDGTAEIITDDMRLIEHFIRPILSLFVNN